MRIKPKIFFMFIFIIEIIPIDARVLDVRRELLPTLSGRKDC